MQTAPSQNPPDGVVFLHGISRTFRSFRKMQRAVEASGFVALNVGYRSLSRPLQTLADDIHPMIGDFIAGHPGTIYFVCHSMGGLLARVYLARYRPPRLGRVVMLGTPNGGSEIADSLKSLLPYRLFFGPAGQQLVTRRDAATEALMPPVDYPVGIIAGNRTLDPLSSLLFLPGPNDGRVTIASTRLDGMADHIVIGADHALMIRNPQAIAQTIAFLRHGAFGSAEKI